MKTFFKKLTVLSLTAMLGICTLSGCGSNDSTSDKSQQVYTEETYVFVGKDMQNTYMQKVYAGFKASCSELGVNAVYEAPDAPTAELQAEIIDRLVEQKVAGIAIAANDQDSLEPSLKAAMDAGIKVISLDSAVNKDSRMVHIQQADPEKVGRTLIESAYDICGGTGGIAILSSTEQATNQNLWIEYMQKELDENKEKYASMPLIKIAYGDDDPTKSKSETRSLLKNPDIKVIISPTSVGILAAGESLKNTSYDVRITGLGMPSQISEYIENGICPQAFLWDPSDMGYLAGYTIKALANGSISGAVGDTFSAGTLGDKKITADTSGGTEIVLGDLLKFDRTNINDWRDAF